MKSALASCAVAWTAVLAAASPSILVSRDVYLMGTRASLATHAVSRDAGIDTLESALHILEGTEAELSTWRADSAISALNRQPIHEPWTATPALCRMFGDLQYWQEQTEGAFDPAIGALLTAWDIHGSGAIPGEAALASARSSSGMRLFTFDRPGCTVTRRANVVLDVGAFGKGEALDRVAAAVHAAPWMIDLGGQLSVGATPPPDGAWTIAIAHPRRRDVPFVHVRLTHGSLSTSAGSERDHAVGAVRVGHILDPRTGVPATFDGSVTVWHERGLVADILSTALYVMGPVDGLRWAEDRGIAAAYLVPGGDDVRMARTAAFQRLVAVSEPE
jgi:thiamine biosynthesis lipoprotein